MEYTRVQLRKRVDKNKNEYYDVAIYYANTNCSVDEKKELIVSTGVKVPKKYVTEKSKEISKKFPDYEKHYETINSIKERVELIISDYYKKYKTKPLCSYVDEQYKKPIVLEAKKLESITDYYNQFLIWKSGFVKESSMGFYRNNISAFEAFESCKNKNIKIQFTDLETLEFWERFIKFLAYEKEDTTRVSEKHKRKGLSNNTLIKRLKTITEYFRYVINYQNIQLNYVKICDYIKQVKRKNEIESYETTKFSLTLDELNYYYNFTPSQYQKEKDLFLFLSLQGTRISDGLSISDFEVVKRNGKIYIQKIAKKTTNQFIVEFHPLAYEVWLKWDGFRDVYEQDFNERIKEIMKEFFLWYKPLYEERFDDEYQLTINVYSKKGAREKVETVFKWEIVSSHYGRSNFISLLSTQGNKLSLKELGIKTGQKDVRTIMGYQKPTREVSAEELLPLTKIDTQKKKAKIVKLKRA